MVALARTDLNHWMNAQNRETLASLINPIDDDGMEH